MYIDRPLTVHFFKILLLNHAISMLNSVTITGGKQATTYFLYTTYYDQKDISLSVKTPGPYEKKSC